MKHSTRYANILNVLLLGVFVACVIFILPVTFSGDRKVGVVETIHGIPFAIDNSTIHIEEDLAHADIFLQEPVFAKQLDLTISFDPKNTQTIKVGVREGGFWLGYAKKQLYERGKDQQGFQTKKIQFPLTTMFQETNRSIDVMIFSESKLPVSWEIHTIDATTTFVAPSFSEFKEYLKSILTRERAL